MYDVCTNDDEAYLPSSHIIKMAATFDAHVTECVADRSTNVGTDYIQSRHSIPSSLWPAPPPMVTSFIVRKNLRSTCVVDAWCVCSAATRTKETRVEFYVDLLDGVRVCQQQVGITVLELAARFSHWSLSIWA